MGLLRDLSLKYKLILLLVLLTSTMLSTYGLMTLRDFEKDKIAYVLDSSLAYARVSALQIRTEVASAIERVIFLTNNSQDAAGEVVPLSDGLFDAILIFKTGQTVEQNPQVFKNSTITDAALEDYKAKSRPIIAATLVDKVTVSRLTENKWMLGLRQDRPGSTPVVTIAIVTGSEFLSLFQNVQILDNYLVSPKALAIMSPQNQTFKLSEADRARAFSETLKKITSPDGLYQYRDTKSEVWFIATASVGIGQLHLMSVIPRRAALEALKGIVFKSIVFLAFLFCITIFLSILSSTTLTASLKKLLQATQEIAVGKFNVSVKISGHDEIGSLAKGFNKMTVEIQRLMQETAQKARMENELKTAQLVQSTLFPKSDLSDEAIEIKGFYQPASECSGDLWYYKKLKNKTIFCIGDATGHGAPAALLTAAVRSAASTLENFPDLSLSEMMSIFNRAIYDTTNGKVMMTFFLGAYDYHSGKVTYVNASHEPPCLLPFKEKLSRKDLVYLNKSRGSRLGENYDSVYESAEIQLNSGDRIMIYTDGVTELKNKSGDTWGERAFLKCLISSINDRNDLAVSMNKLSQELSAFRGEQSLHDDVTYFMIQRI
jgi:phosphoserine phosphatase RsbU/P